MCTRSFAIVLLALILAPLASAQQSGKLPRIAYVDVPVPPSELAGFPDPPNAVLRAFFHRLQELGWEEGKNILIERYALEGHGERLPELMAKLVREQVDVIVPANDGVITLALQATHTIPIVGCGMAEPIQAGWVKSIAHPDVNLTGFTSEVDFRNRGKRLQLLTEMVPGIRRVVVFSWEAGGPPPYDRPIVPELAKAAEKLGVELIPVSVRHDQIEDDFGIIRQAHPDALFVEDSSTLWFFRQRVAEFALENRLPAIGPSLDRVEAGLLMAYAMDWKDAWRGSAEYVDKILKGKKPGDLPIQQPMRFYLWVNKKTADALSIEIPPIILLQADRVIK